jgi:LysM repeat protein
VRDGSKIIIPEGVTILLPPRTFSTLKANPGDTLEQIAKNYGVELALLEEDNPILATRGVNPGDTIFIPKLI